MMPRPHTIQPTNSIGGAAAAEVLRIGGRTAELAKGGQGLEQGSRLVGDLAIHVVGSGLHKNLPLFRFPALAAAW